MNEMTLLLRDQRTIDARHLDLLAIFHFALTGLALLGIGVLFLHYMFFVKLFINNPHFHEGPNPGTPPPAIIALFKVVYVFSGVLLSAAAVGNVLSGIWLRARRHRPFSFGVAILNCLQMPFGTVLGIFTIIVLVRDSVRELYASRASATTWSR